MNRRLVGALVVALSVAAAIAAPGGSLVSGDARPAPLPREPAVGDCIVGDIPEPRGGDFDPATVTAGEEISSPFGPCTGERGGEVVLVGTARGSVDDRLRIASELSDDCARTARAVAGITAHELASRESGIRWTLSPNARYRWVVPDPRARAGGQTWLACVATSASALRYSGTVADAFSGGRLPDAFGSCWAGDVVSAALTAAPCSEPHRAELVAIGRPAQDGITMAITRGSCGDLTAHVMNRTEPEEVGDVEIVVHPANIDERSAERLRRTDIVCYVVGTEGRQVVGTIVGIGDRPLGSAGR
jgi:hypothetical protein